MNKNDVESLEVFNSAGILVKEFFAMQNSINIKDLNAGAYILRVNSANKSYSKSFIKQ